MEKKLAKKEEVKGSIQMGTHVVLSIRIPRGTYDAILREVKPSDNRNVSHLIAALAVGYVEKKTK